MPFRLTIVLVAFCGFASQAAADSPLRVGVFHNVGQHVGDRLRVKSVASGLPGGISKRWHDAVDGLILRQGAICL